MLRFLRSKEQKGRAMVFAFIQTPVRVNSKIFQYPLLRTFDRLDIFSCSGLDLVHHLVITIADFLLKSKPLLEEKFSLFVFHFPLCSYLGTIHGNAALANAKYPFEKSPDLIRVSYLDLQIQQDIPEIDPLGERRQQPFKHSSTTLDVSVRRSEL